MWIPLILKGLEWIDHLFSKATDDDQVRIILLAELPGFIPWLGGWGEVVTLSLKRDPTLRAGDPGTIWRQNRMLSEWPQSQGHVHGVPYRVVQAVYCSTPGSTIQIDCSVNQPHGFVQCASSVMPPISGQFPKSHSPNKPRSSRRDWLVLVLMWSMSFFRPAIPAMPVTVSRDRLEG